MIKQLNAFGAAIWSGPSALLALAAYTIRLFLFIAAAVIALGASLACAGEVKVKLSCETYNGQKDCSSHIEINGEITASTLEDLKKAFEQRDGIKGREGVSDYFKRNEINSPGGSVSVALEIGRLFRSRGEHIFVEP